MYQLLCSKVRRCVQLSVHFYAIHVGKVRSVIVALCCPQWRPPRIRPTRLPFFLGGRQQPPLLVLCGRDSSLRFRQQRWRVWTNLTCNRDTCQTNGTGEFPGRARRCHFERSSRKLTVFNLFDVVMFRSGKGGWGRVRDDHIIADRSQQTSKGNVGALFRLVVPFRCTFLLWRRRTSFRCSATNFPMISKSQTTSFLLWRDVFRVPCKHSRGLSLRGDVSVGAATSQPVAFTTAAEQSRTRSIAGFHVPG